MVIAPNGATRVSVFVVAISASPGQSNIGGLVCPSQLTGSALLSLGQLHPAHHRHAFPATVSQLRPAFFNDAADRPTDLLSDRMMDIVFESAGAGPEKFLSVA
jgi:hypothetical protein